MDHHPLFIHQRFITPGVIGGNALPFGRHGRVCAVAIGGKAIAVSAAASQYVLNFIVAFLVRVSGEIICRNRQRALSQTRYE